MKTFLAFVICLLLAGCADMASSFKFVSSGQAVADAAVATQTLRGNSLKPLASGNITAYRDAANNAIFKWTRRSRIAGGMRPLTDVPLAEEAEIYDVEFYNGASLVRTMRVTIPPAHPVIWNPAYASGYNVVGTDGTIQQSATDTAQSARSLQMIVGDFQLETTLDHSVRLGFTQTDGILTIRPVNGSWDTGDATPPGYFHNDTYVTFENTPGMEAYDLISGERLMIELRGRTFNYYRNYAGGQTQPIFTSTRNNIPFPLFIFATLNGSAGQSPILLDNITRPTLKAELPTCLYTAGQQTADGLTPGNAVKVIVYQVSAIVGRGPGRTATL